MKITFLVSFSPSPTGSTTAHPACPGVADPADHVTAELRALYASFQRCLNLRDKYMRLSRQRLEDNPANYDGNYSPSPSPSASQTTSTDPQTPEFKPWVIYPPPPDPHWKERDPFAEATETTEEIAEREAKRREFHWDQIKIPGKESIERQKRFVLDSRGVYQVVDSRDLLDKPLYEVPTIKEYFQDLDEILSVISDGPAKSFAWRRLRYLESKWNLYVLLNEYRELADMKVSFDFVPLFRQNLLTTFYVLREFPIGKPAFVS